MSVCARSTVVAPHFFSDKISFGAKNTLKKNLLRNTLALFSYLRITGTKIYMTNIEKNWFAVIVNIECVVGLTFNIIWI